MKNKLNTLVIFGFGGILYGLVEVLIRGYTHWTMVLTGGIIFSVLYQINLKMENSNLFLRCLIGCMIITAAEFTVGCIVNIDLGMGVWDYSGQKYNVMGQICPLYSLGWFFICLPASGISFLLRRSIRK